MDPAARVPKAVFVVEPNKTGLEHCFFNAAMIDALASEGGTHGDCVTLFCERGHRDAIVSVLPAAATVPWKEVVVMPGTQRNFVKKFVTEAALVCRIVRHAKANHASVILLSMFPNVLATLLLLRPLFRCVDVHVVLHCEVESLIIREKRGIHREGFWTRLALLHLFRGGWPTLYVLGAGIRARLLQTFPDRKQLQDLRFINHPYIFAAPTHGSTVQQAPLRVGFVGTGRIVKGITQFFLLARSMAQYVTAGKLEFVVVGGVEADDANVDRTWVRVMSDGPGGLPVEEFTHAVAELDCALFLYRQNYSFTASGAVFDVINAGVEILSLPNHYLSDLARDDHEGGIQFFDDIEAIAAELGNRIESGRAPRALSYPHIRHNHGTSVRAALRKELFGR